MIFDTSVRQHRTAVVPNRTNSSCTCRKKGNNSNIASSQWKKVDVNVLENINWDPCQGHSLTTMGTKEIQWHQTHCLGYCCIPNIQHIFSHMLQQEYLFKKFCISCGRAARAGESIPPCRGAKHRSSQHPGCPLQGEACRHWCCAPRGSWTTWWAPKMWDVWILPWCWEAVTITAQEYFYSNYRHLSF